MEGRSRDLIRGTLGVYLQILRHTEEDLSPDRVAARLDLNQERSRYNAEGVTYSTLAVYPKYCLLRFASVFLTYCVAVK